MNEVKIESPSSALKTTNEEVLDETEQGKLREQIVKEQTKLKLMVTTEVKQSHQKRSVKNKVLEIKKLLEKLP